MLENKLYNQVLSRIFFPTSGQTAPIPVEFIFKNIIRPKKAKLGFFNFGPILSSLVPQLHYKTHRCRTKEISMGCFSIRHQTVLLAQCEPNQSYPSILEILLLTDSSER